MPGTKSKSNVQLRGKSGMGKKYYHMLINYKDAKPGELHWWEESWLDCSPKEMVQEFNTTLHPGERARKLIDYEILEGENKPHSWKKTNLVTQIKNGLQFDSYRCDICGVTGKRYGLGGYITLDTKYKKQIYCKSK